MDIVDIVRARLRDGRPIGDAYAADLISRIEALETQLAEQIDYKAAFIEARFQLNAADALAEKAQRTLDGYGFTADGNDTWREVLAVDLQEMEEAVVTYIEAKKGPTE